MSTKAETINNIFEEIVTWENVPINRVLGNLSIDRSQSLVKRIIMFGATQMGKTTVIMSLLGIKAEKREELDDILRGGAKAGKSSTSTTVIYLKSKDNLFGYYEGEIEGIVDEKAVKYYDPDSFRNYLCDLKNKNRQASLSNGIEQLLKATYIYIPQNYFSDNAYSGLQIVDSRGFGERSAKDQNGYTVTSDQINKFIDSLMHFASGVVAVTSADKMQYLRSDYKSILNEKSKNQVLIVLTHAIKNNDVLPDRNMSPKAAADFLIDYYNNKIIKEGYVDSLFGGRIFPFEKKEYLTEVGYSGEIADWIYKAIISEIDKMNCKTSISMCKDNIDVQINNRRKEIEEIKAEISDFETDISKLKMQIEKQNKELLNLEKTIEKKEKEQELPLKELGSAKRLCAWTLKKIKDDEYKNKVDEITLDRKNDNSNRSKLTKTVREAVMSNFDKSLPPKYISISERLTDEYLTKNVDEYYFTKSFFTFKSTWEEDINGNAECAETDCLEFVLNKLKTHLEADIKSIKKKFNTDNETADSKKLTRVLNDKKDKRENLESKKKNDERRIEEKEKAINTLVSAKENITELFVKAFYEKKEELSNRINSEKDPEIKSALLITMLSIYEKMKDVINEYNEKTGGLIDG